jgi:nucleoside-diphosphate-sugar epimerase
MKIFVTGGTGFIGVPTVKNLVDSEHQCNCLIRGSSKKEALERLGCDFVTGDVTDKGSHSIDASDNWGTEGIFQVSRWHHGEMPRASMHTGPCPTDGLSRSDCSIWIR